MAEPQRAEGREGADTEPICCPKQQVMARHEDEPRQAKLFLVSHPLLQILLFLLFSSVLLFLLQNLLARLLPHSPPLFSFSACSPSLPGLFFLPDRYRIGLLHKQWRASSIEGEHAPPHPLLVASNDE